MKKFKNNNERFGYEGPVDAESKEVLADEILRGLIAFNSSFIKFYEELRDEFIDSLEEIEE